MTWLIADARKCRPSVVAPLSRVSMMVSLVRPIDKSIDRGEGEGDGEARPARATLDASRSRCHHLMKLCDNCCYPALSCGGRCNRPDCLPLPSLCPTDRLAIYLSWSDRAPCFRDGDSRSIGEPSTPNDRVNINFKRFDRLRASVSPGSVSPYDVFDLRWYWAISEHAAVTAKVNNFVLSRLLYTYPLTYFKKFTQVSIAFIGGSRTTSSLQVWKALYIYIYIYIYTGAHKERGFLWVSCASFEFFCVIRCCQ